MEIIWEELQQKLANNKEVSLPGMKTDFPEFWIKVRHFLEEIVGRGHDTLKINNNILISNQYNRGENTSEIKMTVSDMNCVYQNAQARLTG